MTTVNTIEDLVRILDERPEWNEALRARVLSRELLNLPQTLADFAESTERRLAALEATSSLRRNGLRCSYSLHAGFRDAGDADPRCTVHRTARPWGDAGRAYSPWRAADQEAKCIERTDLAERCWKRVRMGKLVRNKDSFSTGVVMIPLKAFFPRSQWRASDHCRRILARVAGLPGLHRVFTRPRAQTCLNMIDDADTDGIPTVAKSN